MKRLSFAAILGTILSVHTVAAGEFSKNPEHSVFIGFDMGGGLDVGSETRFPEDTYHSLTNPGAPNPEAYSMGSFLFGLYAGFRFNENFAIEGGWHEQQHETDPVWGGTANYELGHLALRLAMPFRSRQTILLRLGPALGGFSYGEANIGLFDDNQRFVAGGLLGVTLEHEFALGIVGTVNFTYLPMMRVGGGESMQLCAHVTPERAADYDWSDCPVNEPYEYYSADGSGPYEWVLYGEKDFSEDQPVHVLWISLGLQFEWIFR